MEIRELTEGRIIGIDPERLQLPLYADPPRIRVGAPGTIVGNVGLYVMLTDVFKRQTGKTEPTLATVVFREVNKEIFLLVAPAEVSGPNVYELKFESNTKAPTIRGLKPLFEAAKIILRDDVWYDLKTEMVRDAQLGYAVAGNWTEADAWQPVTDREAAAGQQHSGPVGAPPADSPGT